MTKPRSFLCGGLKLDEGDPLPNGRHIVELSATGRGVRFSVVDNGVGLAENHAEGFGLRGMKARVTQVGGTMSVSPTPGGGVTVEVEVPT